MSGRFLEGITARAMSTTDQAVRKFVLEIVRRVVLRSPVRTGRFKGNWIVDMGAIPTGVLDRADPTGDTTISEATERVRAMRIVDDSPIWIANNLPYAQRLEYGHSKQAPHGMVRITLAELAAKYGA